MKNRVAQTRYGHPSKRQLSEELRLKQVLDQLKHLCGDQALRALARGTAWHHCDAVFNTS